MSTLDGPKTSKTAMVNVPTTILTAISDSRLFLHRKSFIAAAISPRADLAPGGWIYSTVSQAISSLSNINLKFCWFTTLMFFLNAHVPLVYYTIKMDSQLVVKIIAAKIAPRHLRCSGTLRLAQCWKLTGSKCGHKIGQLGCQAA